MNTVSSIHYPQLARQVERFGHPLILICSVGLWWIMGQGDEAALVALVLSLLVMELLERLVPAMPQWRQGGGEKLRLIGVYVIVLVAFGLVVTVYQVLLLPALSGFRDSVGSAIWPTDWPVLLQVMILYFASDFIYYWIHRAIHSSAVLWRLSGHSFHHAFQNLHAINLGATHPFEVFFLAVPTVLLASVFGVSDKVMAGATVLLLVNGTLAHANVRMETPIFSWFFTASNHHRRHHSVVFEEANTNYACNAIIWDRLFGTYSYGDVQQTGIGPQQPSLWQMFMLPFREPEDVNTVASRT